MINCTLIIEALHKGRELYPEKECGSPFSSNNKGACAIGAIAAGLGFVPDNTGYGRTVAPYDFVQDKLIADGIEPKIAYRIINHIWSTNDSCWDDDTEEMIVDPDLTVIESLKANYCETP
jgi:hypothetical protein